MCKVVFELDKQEWEEALNKAYEKTKHKYKLQGFRQGKVPRKYIESVYGSAVFFDEGFNLSFPVYYSKMLEENEDIYPVQPPNLDIMDYSETKGIKFSAEFFVKPDVELGQYRDLKIPVSTTQVTQDDIDREINIALDKASRKLEVDRPIKNGDFINLDYSGKIDGVIFEGGTAEDQELEIGSNTFIKGFEEQLLGANIGDQKTITVKFPEDYHSQDLASKDATFDCKIIKIKEKQTPSFDDEFAKDTSTFDTVDEYKTDLVNRLKKANEANDSTRKLNLLLSTIADNAKVDIPSSMVETQLDEYIKEFEYRVKAGGLKFEDYLKFTCSTIEDLRNMRRDEATKKVKLNLVVEAIINQEKLAPASGKIDEKLSKRASSNHKSLEEYKANVTKDELANITNEAVIEMILEWLKLNNTFVDDNTKDTKPTSDKTKSNEVVAQTKSKKVTKPLESKEKSKPSVSTKKVDTKTK